MSKNLSDILHLQRLVAAAYPKPKNGKLHARKDADWEEFDPGTTPAIRMVRSCHGTLRLQWVDNDTMIVMATSVSVPPTRKKHHISHPATSGTATIALGSEAEQQQSARWHMRYLDANDQSLRFGLYSLGLLQTALPLTFLAMSVLALTPLLIISKSYLTAPR